MTTKDFLTKLKDVFSTRNWCQGKYHTVIDGVDSCCLVGAFQLITDPDVGAERLDSYDLLQNSCQADGFNGIVQWNDAPGRTKDQVLAKIDSVIVGLPEAT